MLRCHVAVSRQTRKDWLASRRQMMGLWQRQTAKVVSQITLQRTCTKSAALMSRHPSEMWRTPWIDCCPTMWGPVRHPTELPRMLRLAHLPCSAP